ncbi:MAG TPA: hypothetical protein VJX67_01835 [Blastocatellia bacterium]|nr:hypothetical protein [Blastocatellia bacterium]
MSLKLCTIDRVSENAYRLTLEAGRKTLAYTVTVAEDPVPGIQAPDPLWRLLGNDREPLKKLVDAVFELHRGRALALPVIIRQSPSADEEAAEIDRLAGARR